MLIEALSRQTIDPQTLDEATRACSPALDELWKTTPIRDSIAKNDVNLAEQLRGTADAIRESSDAVLVVAGRSEGAAIRAALSAIEKKDGSPEVTVTGTSLSAAGYAAIFERLDNKRVSLIAVSCSAEDLPLRAAYAILKAYVFKSAKREGGPARVYAVVADGPGGSRVIARDAAENEYPIIRLPENTDPRFTANTAAVLLPFMVKGGDVREYIRAFGETVASPEWDGDGTVTAYLMSRASVRLFETWQAEYGDMTRWLASSGGIAVMMPDDTPVKREILSRGDVFELMIGSDEGHQDVMTPLFDGCDPDGSLELLTLSESERDFFGTEAGQGIKLRAERADSAACGALMAFCQMTLYIADYLEQ